LRVFFLSPPQAIFTSCTNSDDENEEQTALEHKIDQQIRKVVSESERKRKLGADTKFSKLKVKANMELHVFLLLFILSSSDWSSSFELLPIAFV
jgi:hypothetical protein